MKLLDYFKECTYNIGFVKKELDAIFTKGFESGDIVWMKHKYKDRFFADPFLVKVNENNFYILCEEFAFWERVGKIVLLTVDKKTYQLTERKLLIKEEHHLSFPYCELNGEWVVPEACFSGKAYAYQLDLDKMMVKRKIQLADEGLVDNVFYEAEDRSIWLYSGTRKEPNDKLYEYRFDGKSCFLRAKQKPVASGLDCSRSAGRFFTYKNKLYRPVQDCTERYGKQTKIMEVLKIGGDGYCVKECCTLNSFENPPYNETMHTFNVYDKIILVDGSKDILRLPRNIFYKRVFIRARSYILKLKSLWWNLLF